MKKILIFYASYGGGHLSAAKAIKKCIDETYNNVETEMVDCVKYINKTLEKVTTAAYKEMAKKAPWVWGRVYNNSKSGPLAHISSRSNSIMAIKLKRLLNSYNPDLVICTHPFAAQMTSYLKRKNKVNCSLATILTDFAPHEQWLIGNEYIDYFFVAHDEMKKDLIEHNIDSNKIYVTGIPISDRFTSDFDNSLIYKEFNLNKEDPIALFFGGGEYGLGKDKTLKILKALLTVKKNIQVIAISGKNEKMKTAFDNLSLELNVSNRLHILEYTDKVPELMHISNIVITKPGGLTSSESMASHLPMIIINPIPGQEEENADFLEKSGVAKRIRNVDEAESIISSIFESDEILNKMKFNCEKLAKPFSTKTICNILLN